MIHIAICDDEPPHAAEIRRLTENWAQSRGQAAKLSVYHSAEALLFALADSVQMEILLLDVQMPGMDGVALARKLRRNDKSLQIVFISGFADYMPYGYDVGAVHYLLKPVNAGKLSEVLDRAVELLKRSKRYVVFDVSGESVRVAAEDIVYAEAFSHEIELHSAGRVLNLRMSMNRLEEVLGEGFFRCHRSFIVHLRYVEGIRRNAVILEGGGSIPLSRRLYDTANRVFIQYNTAPSGLE
jgi:DNA-binding LytR/AlgR family response regulator